MAGRTPSQTIGPFFHGGLAWAEQASRKAADDTNVEVVGRVLDADGTGVSDAVLEIWEPELSTRTAPLAGWQRVATDPDGGFHFHRSADSRRAAHVVVFARGLLNGLFTRCYLPAVADETIPVEVPRTRVATLIAVPGDTADVVRWDIKLSGDGETVFLRWR
jgi:protocatechuate 3,4-dioxygenase alpha subunit